MYKKISEMTDEDKAEFFKQTKLAMLMNKDMIIHNEKNLDKLPDYYTEVLLHIIWITIRKSNGDVTRYLVHAILEFYPKEISPNPLTEQEGRFKGFRIYYQRIRIQSVLDAISLYRWIQSSSCIPMFWDEKGIVNDEVLKLRKSADVNIKCECLDDYIIWPNFIISSKKSEKRDDDNPFIADIWNSVRTHQLLPQEINTFVADVVGHENVGLWFERYTGWNISYYRELIGSVVMVFPNPYYSKMSIRVIPIPELDCKKQGERELNTENKNLFEKVRIEFIPRHNVDLSTLTVTTFENTHFGISGGQEYNICDNIITLPVIEQQIEQFGCYVKDDNGELLDYYDLAGFLRKIQIDIHTGGITKRVRNIKGDGYNEIQTYDKTTTISNEKDVKPLGKRLTDAEISRRKKRQVDNSGVRYFYEDHEAAEQYVKGLLYNAKDEVIIVDPYAATNELFTYAMNVSSNDVKITFFTSKVYLREKSKLSIYKEKGLQIPILGNELQTQIANYHKCTGTEVKVLVMTGEQPAIHDRFLIIDDTAWFCGGSFNELGNRLSCMIKLPDSKEIKRIIYEIGNSEQVKTLDEWLAERSSAT